ncbi:plasmid partitioning protein RepB [Roseobacteraceae bacterium S113]
MARKNLLKGLMDEAKQSADETGTPGEDAAPSSGSPGARVDPAKPRYTTGAIGAVSQSIQSLKSRSVTEIDPHDIEAGGLEDRLGYDDDDAHFELVESLKAHGQQVPLMVRPHPDKDGKYQIVYGRRRVLALRDAGLHAKALIRDLDDAALVMAQGIENSARRDLSFIEKCNFAAQMREAGYKRKAICEALSVDKTQISRMLQIYDRVGVDMIEAIGAVPGVGRERWAKLADFMQANPDDWEIVAKTVQAYVPADPGPDDRFEAALRAVGMTKRDEAKTETKPAKDGAKTLSRRTAKSDNGFEIGRVVRTSEATLVTLPRDGSGAFGDWLDENLEDVYRQWLKDHGEA